MPVAGCILPTWLGGRGKRASDPAHHSQWCGRTGALDWTLARPTPLKPLSAAALASSMGTGKAAQLHSLPCWGSPQAPDIVASLLEMHFCL